MERLRLAIKKDGALQFLSHLDFARTVRYIIIRAALPVCYSEGFNPHMKISFASALGVGVSADIEYMDMELSEKIPVPNVISRMNSQSPKGFAALDGKYVDDKAPKLMAVANYSIYELTGPINGIMTTAQLEQSLIAFNTAAEVTYEKISIKDKHKVRVIDIKKHVIEPITGYIKTGRIFLHVGIYQTKEGAVKPSQIWQVLETQFKLPAYTDMMLARRTGIYIHENGVNRSLFEV